MPDISDLLRRLSAAEDALAGQRFVAPCVRGGRVRVRVAGMVCTFAPKPSDFQGWGVFEVENERAARFVEEPQLFQIADFLQMFPASRLRLAYRLAEQTWLAFPAHAGDWRQRFQSEARPVVVQLVNDGQEFAPVIAHHFGGAWWFGAEDLRAAPVETDKLRETWRERQPPENLRWPGLTPEMRSCYSLLWRREVQQQEWLEQQSAAAQERRDEARLRNALEFGGGDLRGFRDRGDHWLVEWQTAGGEWHNSAVAKQDLTVISAGICLSGEDRKFDLQSLVAVVEGQEW
jgi:hypothetical protein